VPVVASVEEAAALGADILVPAIAPPGGVLPPAWRVEIVDALRHGMSIVNGLHASMAADPEFAAAKAPEAFIADIRREPDNVRNGLGLARELACRRILTVGTDMAIGKMTVSLACDRAATDRGLRSSFAATGQIGICISGDGVALDAVRVDFASGAVEQLVERLASHAELVWVEGQGSVLHPASTAWLPLMRGSMPTHMILCHRAGQDTVARAPWVRIPPLAEVAKLYEQVAAAAGALPTANVVAVAVNTSHLSDSEARDAIARIADETGLPATDPIRFGADILLDAVLG
jgi:uncharacterized NAD-dependent epimerase/dehydratase family protein